MPLESCMILLDCSEYMRNGDYVPTRLSAQTDAANLLVSAKTQSHPESTVGVSAGTELLVSPTDNVGVILNALHDVRLQQQQLQQDVCSAVQVASLALKHRRNKNGAQRIVLFVGSPVIAESRALIKAGRQLKKNNVGIDVVCMGELETNEEKMRELVDAANGRAVEGAEAAERTCHLVTIPAGVLPSDVLASSPILAQGGGGGGYGAAAGEGDGGFGAAGGGGGESGGGGGGGFSDYGVDPNMDPELAMALRVSMEEERARQERVAAAAATEAGGEAEAGGGETKSEDAEMTEAAAPEAKAAPTAADMGLSEEEALLQQALAMSMNENEPTDEETKTGGEDDSKPAAAPMDVEDEDSAMQMALQMSMQNEAAGGGDAAAAASAEFQDPAFVNELLGSMPGVDPNDPEIQQALRQAVAAKKQVDDEKKKKQQEEEDKKE
jgi:26S proteasome regulatory subunit N10